MGDRKKSLEATQPTLSFIMEDIVSYRSLLRGGKNPEISDETISAVTRELDVIRQNISNTMRPFIRKGGEGENDTREMVRNDYKCNIM